MKVSFIFLCFVSDMYDLKNVPYLLKTAVNVEDVSFNTCYDYNVSSLRNLSSTCKELDLHSCKFNNKNHAKEVRIFFCFT